jgi:SAM-dependent methyltransferase
VLDVGCGAGSNVLWLARSGYQAYGVDLAPGAIRAARARAAEAGLAIDVRPGDALALPFGDAGFDALVDHGCFHTLPLERRADYAREVDRVLRPDARLLLCWVAREHEGPGPPHRPSLSEVAEVFEGRFLFARTRFWPGGDDGLPSYSAWLAKRTGPQPSPR